MDKKNIVLFDGVCNLCNNTVDFIITKDQKQSIFFCPLQSQTAQNLLQELNYKTPPLSSIVFVHNHKVYNQSTAVLYILKELGFPWSLFFIFILFPKPFRDLCYNLIAKNRYRLFGKKDTCRLPTPEERARFIE